MYIFGKGGASLMVTDGFSLVRGSHTLKFGGEFRYLQINERNVATPNGSFTFDGSVTGVDAADYLLGAVSVNGSAFQQYNMQFLDSRTPYGGAYGQDSWKVKPNFTLTLGLCWEVSMPWYDTQAKIETIVLPHSAFNWAPATRCCSKLPAVWKTFTYPSPARNWRSFPCGLLGISNVKLVPEISEP